MKKTSTVKSKRKYVRRDGEKPKSFVLQQDMPGVKAGEIFDLQFNKRYKIRNPLPGIGHISLRAELVEDNPAWFVPAPTKITVKVPTGAMVEMIFLRPTGKTIEYTTKAESLIEQLTPHIAMQPA